MLATPLPSPIASAVTVEEDFSTDPMTQGWQLHGDGTLFSWDSTNQLLSVTWDSARTNSYFHLPLNTLLTRRTSFSASFDLRMDDLAAGATTGKPYTFQIAVCLFEIAAAKRTNFFVGAGASPSSGPRSTMEFNYFPGYEDPIYGEISDTFAAIVVPTNTNPFLYSHDFPRALDTGVWHRITLNYSATNETLTLTKTRAGMPYGVVQSIPLTGMFSDFNIDTFAIASYSDAVGLGSVLAHGVIDNISITLPDPPIAGIFLTLTNGPQAHFLSSAGWTYALERSQSGATWVDASAKTPGTGSLMLLTDTNAPPDHALYRVRAQEP